MRTLASRLPIARMITDMSAPVLKIDQSHSVAAFVERHDVLRMIMDWFTDRFAETAEEADTSIDWEDGEEHDEPVGPTTI